MISIKNLKKSFGSEVIYDDLSVNIPQGSFFAILGESGCGKSVLLKHILGLIDPDEGSIHVDDFLVNGAKESEKNINRRNWSMVFQEGALFDSLSIWENVVFSLRYHSSLSEGELKEIALEKLKWVNLEDKMNSYPADLSGGMRKRVAIARAVAISPKIIFYDEPTTGLDPITCGVINSLMLRLHKKTGATSVMVTHDLQSVYSVCDRIAMLGDGKIIFEGTIKEMKESDNSRLVAFLRGSLVDFQSHE